MKKNIIIGSILLVLLVIGLGVGMFLVQQQQDLRKKAAPATTLSILPPTKTANVGDEVTLTVQMNTATNSVTGAELHITFDAQKLTLRDFTPLTDLLPVVFVSPQINNTAGTASMTVSAQPANPAQGTGGVATLKFLVKAPGQAAVGFDTQTLATGISEGTNVLVSQNSATLTLLAAGGGTTPTPTQAAGASPTPTPTRSSSGIATPTPTSTGSPIGGLSTTSTPIPTTTKIATTTPTRTAATSSAGTPVAGVSLPIVLSLGTGFLLLALGIILAL